MALKMSTRGRYGLRALVDLARFYGRGPVLARAIAERQGLSSKYLHALLSSLKDAGLVGSVRGSGGGYVLARPPSAVRVLDVICALEGPVTVVDCVADPSLCDRARTCDTRDLWCQLSRRVEQLFEEVTLEDLMARCGAARGRRAGRAAKGI